jgi:hypothetical protein
MKCEDQKEFYEQIEKSTDLWYIYQVMNLFIKGMKGCFKTIWNRI